MDIIEMIDHLTETSHALYAARDELLKAVQHGTNEDINTAAALFQFWDAKRRVILNTIETMEHGEA